jgi:hypothetical protein
MTNLSSTAIQALFAAETDEVFVVLITISHPELSTLLRVCSDAINTTSRSNVFYAYPFDIALPSDEEGAPPQAQITIDNVSQEITNAIRAISSPADFLLEVVRAAAPDTVEVSWRNFKLRNIKGDAAQISGDLTVDDTTREPFPAYTFSPSEFPGLFA